MKGSGYLAAPSTLRVHSSAKAARVGALRMPTVCIAATCALLYAGSPIAAEPAGRDAVAAAEGEAARVATTTDPRALYVADVVAGNPEIKADRNEVEAARQRVQPAGALEDPMLEAGVINAPVSSLSFRREDMTMKMLGLSQKLPYPGKRDLKTAVAARDAESVALAYEETVNRVVRDATVAYADFALVLDSIAISRKTRTALKDYLQIAKARYAVGQGNQSDVFKAQTALSKISADLARLARDQIAGEAELARLAGGTSPRGEVLPRHLELRERSLDLGALMERVRSGRPQLMALSKLIERGTKEIELARKEFYPDFDVRFQFGQRDSASDGASRDDMVSLTVGVNLPIWRERKLMPRVAEATAMRDRAIDERHAEEDESIATLRKQVATAMQSLTSARLYERELLPAAELAVASSLASYKVSRTDFLTLLDSQMAKLEHELAYVALVADYDKALAEIDLLTGTPEVPLDSVSPAWPSHTYRE